MSARKPGHCFTFYVGPTSRKNIASLAELELWFWKPTVPLQPTLKIEKMVLGQGHGRRQGGAEGGHGPPLDFHTLCLKPS